MKTKLFTVVLATVFVLGTVAAHSSHAAHNAEQAPNISQPSIDLPSLPGSASSVAVNVLDTIQKFVNDSLQGLGSALQELLQNPDEVEPVENQVNHRVTGVKV